MWGTVSHRLWHAWGRVERVQHVGRLDLWAKRAGEGRMGALRFGQGGLLPPSPLDIGAFVV